MNTSLLVLLGLLLGLYPSLQAYERTLISPVETNPVLDPTDAEHYVYKPVAGQETGYLLLFYPGTRATPSDYQRLMERAAELGHHVIGLSYPNQASINLNICPGTPTDECFRLARLEIHTGEDLHGEVWVDPDNSIEGRLDALLLHLERTDPDGGWDLFRLPVGSPSWERVIVAGQSQGGGHAGFTAKRHAVARCVMFSATDWWQGAPAAWIREPGATPPERLFGFTHLLDEAVPPNLQSSTWMAYGMTQDGGERVVDAASPPYRGSQRLYAQSPIVFDGDPADNYHNALSVDDALELDGAGRPVALPVWDYLFSMPQAKPAYDFSAMRAFHEELESTFGYPFAVYFYEGDKEVYAYEANLTREDSLPMASASKWLSGCVILAVAEAGFFDLDEPISKYVSAFDTPDKASITIGHGFSMTAGMVPQDSSQNYLQWDPRYNLEESVEVIAASVPVLHTPGEVLYYWGGGMQAAGLAAVEATGLPDWETVAQTFLFGPLGMEDSAFSRFLPNPAVAGGVETTGEDYLTFLAMLSGNGSAVDGEPFLPTASLEPIFSSAGRDKPIAKSPFPTQSPWYPYGREPYYSFGAWVLGDNPASGEVEEVTSPGANGTYPWLDRSRGLHGIFLTNVPAGSSLALDPALQSFHEMRTAYDTARPDRLRALSIGGELSGWIDPEVNPEGNHMTFQTADGRVWLGLLDPHSGALVEGSLEVAATQATSLLVSWNGPEFAVDRDGWSLIYNRSVSQIPQLWEARPTRDGWVSNPIFSDLTVPRVTFLTSQGSDMEEKWVVYVRDDGVQSMLTAASLNDPNKEIPLIPFEARQPSHARFVGNRPAVLFATGPNVASGQLYWFSLPSGQRETVTSSSHSLGLPVAVEAPELGGEMLVGVVEGENKMRFFVRDLAGTWQFLTEMDLPAEAVAEGYTVFSSPEAFVFKGRSWVCLNIERPGTGIGAVEEAQIWLLSPGLGGNDPLLVRCDDGIDPALRTDPEFYATEDEVFVIYNLVTGNLDYEIQRARSGLGPLATLPPTPSIHATSDFLCIEWETTAPVLLEQSFSLDQPNWSPIHEGFSPFWVRLPKSTTMHQFWRLRSITGY